MTTQKTPKQATAMFSVRDHSGTLATSRGKRCLFRLFACVLFALIQLFDEGFRFFLIGEGESCGAFFQLKRVKKGSILIITKAIVDLLVPDNSTIGG
jgi:hypothetical protein